MIIDVHAHLGTDIIFDETRSEQDLLEAMAQSGVDATIVQTMFGTIDIEGIKYNHDRIYKFSKDKKNTIFGMITMTPLLNDETFFDEARRCVEELGFVGLKLHPMAHAVNPTSKKGRMVWEVCVRLHIPIMVHTGAGLPFSLPSMVIKNCMEYAGVKCILAHSGMIAYAEEAFLAGKECSNVYFDTSWTTPHHIERLIAMFGSSRVMFAGDEACNVSVEVAKYKSLNISQEDLSACFWKTANEVFNLGFHA